MVHLWTPLRRYKIPQEQCRNSELRIDAESRTALPLMGVDKLEPPEISRHRVVRQTRYTPKKGFGSSRTKEVIPVGHPSRGDTSFEKGCLASVGSSVCQKRD